MALISTAITRTAVSLQQHSAHIGNLYVLTTFSPLKVSCFLCKIVASASPLQSYRRLLVWLSQQNSPTPVPDPKPTMIDDWAVSVKPNADPTIIKKHIEKMVEVSFFFCLLLPPTRPASFLLTMQVTLRGPEVVRGILLVVLYTRVFFTLTQQTTGG